MDFGANYRFIGVVDPAPLKKRLGAVPASAWGAEDERIHGSFPFLRERRTLMLVSDAGKSHAASPPPTAVGQTFEAEVAPVVERIRSFFDGAGFVQRIAVSALASGKSIPRHVATGGRLLYVHRFHIPIETAERATITVGGEERHLVSGEIWEINNAREHGAANPEPSARTHLLVDYVTPDLLWRWRLLRLRRMPGKQLRKTRPRLRAIRRRLLRRGTPAP